MERGWESYAEKRNDRKLFLSHVSEWWDRVSVTHDSLDELKDILRSSWSSLIRKFRKHIFLFSLQEVESFKWILFFKTSSSLNLIFFRCSCLFKCFCFLLNNELVSAKHSTLPLNSSFSLPRLFIQEMKHCQIYVK